MAALTINFNEVECYGGLRKILVSASRSSPSTIVLCASGQRQNIAAVVVATDTASATPLIEATALN